MKTAIDAAKFLSLTLILGIAGVGSRGSTAHGQLRDPRPVPATAGSIGPPSTPPRLSGSGPPALAPSTSGPSAPGPPALEPPILATPGARAIGPGQPNPLAAGAGPAALPGAVGAGNLAAAGNAFNVADTLAGGSDLGGTRGSFSSSPTILGDFYGGSLSGFSGSTTVTQMFFAPGTILSGNPGSPNSILGFDVAPNGSPTDLFTTGLGQDLSGDGQTDRFGLAEPLPTSDAPGSPGPGFVFDSASATATYVDQDGGTTASDGTYQSGDDWRLAYSYIRSLSSANGSPVVLPGPGVAARRVKIAENYSPDVRDRLYLNYSFFNDASGGLGDISRVVMGMERILVDDLISIEYRLPVAGTFASTQTLNESEHRALEIGNAAVVLKSILFRGENALWAGGLGFSIPTASDSRLRAGTTDLLRVENETFHLQPFSGLLWRPSTRWAFQGLLQADFALNGDPVYGNLAGGRLPKLGEFNDSTLLHADVAATRILFENRNDRFLRSMLVNGELHYTATAQESDFVSSQDLTYSNLARNFNILNATVGSHLVLDNDIVLSPAISLPLRNGSDEQFDYEAILQLNYYR